MSKPSARSMAFDDSGAAYVFVRCGDDHLLTKLDDNDHLQLVRKVSKGLWWFRVSGDFGLFTDDDAFNPIAAYDLRGKGRAKKIVIGDDKRFYSWHRTAATCPGTYAMGTNKGARIYRLEANHGVDIVEDEGQRTKAERAARFYLAAHAGLYLRRLGDAAAGSWENIVEDERIARCKQLLYDPHHDRVIAVGTHRGTGVLVFIGPTGKTHVFEQADEHGFWSAACLSGRLFVYDDIQGVVEISQRGEEAACGVKGQIARNQCLFAGGEALYFVCADRIHRLSGDTWTVIDVAGQRLDTAAVAKSKPPRAPTPTTPADQDVETLIERVVEDLDNLDALGVLADRLQELGDPRGQLIALQCLEEPTKAQQRQVNKLLKAHREAWLGPLASAVARGSVVFRRGFLSELGLKKKAEGQASQLRGCPQWATVRRLEVSMWSDSATLELLGHDVMRNLRIVEGLKSAETLARVGQPAWHTLSLLYLCAAEIEALCTAADNLAALKHLTFNAQDVQTEKLAPVWRSALVQQLETLKVRCRHVVEVAPLWKTTLRSLPQLNILPGGMDSGGGWELLITRRAKKTALRFTFHWPNPQDPYAKLAGLLEALPQLSASSITVVPCPTGPPTSAQKTAIAEAAATVGRGLRWE